MMLHRTRTRIFLVLIAAVVCLSMSVVFAQDAKPEAVGLRPDAPTYALHGPYWVGTRQMEIPEKDGKPALKLTLWYPALNPKNQKEEMIYVLEHNILSHIYMKDLILAVVIKYFLK